MASAPQIELFRQLTEKRQFPADQNTDDLTAQFATLTTKNASDWIDRALQLPMRDETGDTPVPAPF